MTHDMKHLFICLISICISFSLVKYLLRSSAHVLIRLFVFSLSSFRSSLYVLDNSLYQKCLLQVFSSNCGLSFHSLDSILYRAYLNLMKSSLSIISFMYPAFYVISKMSSPSTRSSRFSPVIF